MKSESTKVTKAREHLRLFEQDIAAENAIHHLSEAFDLLTDVVDTDPDHKEGAKAQNLGNSYVSQTVSNAEVELEAATVTEPELKRMFDTLVKIQEYEFGDREALSRVKRNAALALFKKYYQGYSKEQAMRELRDLT